MINKKLTIGIIGGKGGMGRLFKDYLENQGHNVLVASRSTELSLEDCARQSDWLIITVPIDVTEKIIETCAPLIKEDGLIMDLTSLKSSPVKQMEKHSRCEVIGCHPVFGPSVKDFTGQVIVLTPGRGDKWLEKVKEIFKPSGCILKVSTPDAHDQIMSIVQGLVHFTSITFVDTLRALGSDMNEIDDFSSPVYRIRMDFANRILNQDPALYADIALKNPETIGILEAYLKNTLDLLEKVKAGDRQGFIDTFTRASDYLGQRKETAEKKTNQIIDFSSRL